jgi:hypothetical protein
MVSTTFPSISNSTPLPVDPTRLLLGRSLSTCTVKPPKVITIEEDHQRRPASICIDTRSLSSIDDHEEEELMGDFLRGLSKMDGDIVGGRSGSFRTYRRV